MVQVDYSLALANRSAVLQKLNHLEKSIQDIQARTWPCIHRTSSGLLSEENETWDCHSRLTEDRMVLREPTLIAPPYFSVSWKRHISILLGDQ